MLFNTITYFNSNFKNKIIYFVSKMAKKMQIVFGIFLEISNKSYILYVREKLMDVESNI
jgi:hypothetical protein